MVTMSGKPKRLITHSGQFHTDDVFVTALLLQLFPDAEVIRSRDEAVFGTGDIVYDVGKIYDPSRGRYDHHQEQAGRRESGIVYSSFGLVWKEYGVAYCDGNEAVARIIEQKLVTPIDANDNGQAISVPSYEGVYPFTIDDIIGMYNPLRWLHDDGDYDAQFHTAVQLAQGVLSRLRDSIQDSFASQKALLDAYAHAADKRIAVTKKPTEVREVIDQCPELLYVISERPEKTWSILAVPEGAKSFTPRRPFPMTWRGKPAAELSAITSVPDVLFCHVNGFYAVAQSREGAIALAQNALATMD